SQDTWVDFKLFGITGIMFVFIILQTVFISKYLPKEDGNEDTK
ncbi:MAG: septation protein A, partial [Methylophilales bacterium 16-45-9]